MCDGPVIAANPREGSRLLRFWVKVPNTNSEIGTTRLARARARNWRYGDSKATRGGISANSVRLTNPSCSSRFKVRDSICFEMSPISRLISPKRITRGGERPQDQQAPLVADAVEHIAGVAGDFENVHC
jgi:hypothetical protein